MSKAKLLNDYSNKLGLAEIDQDLLIRMAYIHKESDGTYTQLHDDVKCRDFLGDVLYSEQINKPVSIYGFKWDPKKQKIDRDSLRLVLNFVGNIKTLQQFTKNINLVRTIEKQHKLKLTRLYKTQHPDKLILEASTFWLKSTFNMSFYTYLLKCMGYSYTNLDNWFTEIKQFSNNESSYAKQVTNVWPFYVKYLKKINNRLPSVIGDKYTENTSISFVHNSTGFVSRRFFSGKTEGFLGKLFKLHMEYTNDLT